MEPLPPCMYYFLKQKEWYLGHTQWSNGKGKDVESESSEYENPIELGNFGWASHLYN